MKSISNTNTISGLGARGLIILLTVLVASIAAFSQTATIYGGLSNFDVVNHSGHHSHGFEIQLEGIHSANVPYSFSYQRYGAARMTDTATGVIVRWESPYANGAFTATTMAYAGSGQFGGSCYMGSATYDTAGCEHFGVSLNANPTAQHYRWLIEDAANPGTLIAVDPPVALPAPYYYVTPPVQAGEAPTLEAEFEAPEAAENPEVYGDAQWVKVFKTELTREATLDELLTGNAIVPEHAAEVEVEWEIVQAEPATGGNGRGRHRNGGALKFDTRAVVRRYESYNFTGSYDPITHEALCADTVCLTPATDEIGDFIGAQMAAANVAVNAISVTKVGNGTVESADRLIRCGTKCGAGYSAGTLVTLTATAARDNIFTGWTGACTGVATTCTVTVQNAMTVTANFNQTFSFQTKISGKGSVTGSFGIDCGRNCSATVPRGSSGTFIAVPQAGMRFSSWTGPCAGSGVTCNLIINAATSITANFVKQ